MNTDNHQKYTLTALHLLAVAKCDPLKNQKGFHLFDDAIENLNKLSGDGLELLVNGKIKIFNGYLVFFLGDTPAQNWIGGFKESVSSAHKFCRTCEIIHGEIVFVDSEVELREFQLHKDRLNTLNSIELKKF